MKVEACGVGIYAEVYRASESADCVKDHWPGCGRSRRERQRWINCCLEDYEVWWRRSVNLQDTELDCCSAHSRKSCVVVARSSEIDRCDVHSNVNVRPGREEDLITAEQDSAEEVVDARD